MINLIKNNLKNVYFVVFFVSLIIVAVFVIRHYEKDIPIAQNGYLTVTQEDINKFGYIALKGDFRICDGLYFPNDLKNLDLSFKLMTLEDIRKYNFPEGCITAVMTIFLNDININTLVIEELYSANRIYINGELVSKMGIVSKNKNETLTQKKSDLVVLNSPVENKIELVIQIANHELISGQFERNIFIGNFNTLSRFWNFRIITKFITVTAYLTMSFFFFSLFIKNKKYTYLLALSIAGLLNCYSVLTAFEPIVIFKPTGIWYTINSMLATVPTLFAQFFGALSVLLFYQNNWVYKHKNRFICYNIVIFIIVILILIIFDEVVNPLYITTTIYAISLLFYAQYVCIKSYNEVESSAKYTFIGLSSYIISYGTLVITTLEGNPRQTINYYSLYSLLGEMLFYWIISFITITKFSKSFSLSELEEEKLEKLVSQRTDELNVSYEQLVREYKIRKQMLQDISHDLRSPITVAKGYIELIQTGKIKEKDYSKYMAIIHNKINYVSDLIKELFLLIRLESNNNQYFEVENLSKIIKDTIKTLTLDKRNIVLDCEKELLVYCNDKQMYRLFNNLLDNAIEYSTKDSEITIRGYFQENNIIIEITDKGTGIPEDVLPYIFERFTRNDTARSMSTKHFGLGLAISKTIVENHKGTITCTSIVNVETTFKITLPRAKKGGI